MAFAGDKKYRLRVVWLGSEEPIAWIAERSGIFLDALSAAFGAGSWVNLWKKPWPETPEGREQLVADGVSRDENDVAWPRSGYLLTLSSRGSAVRMQANIWAGGVGVGRNLPAHMVDLWLAWEVGDAPSGAQIEDLFAPTIKAWDPVMVTFTHLSLIHSGWQVHPGWLVWLRNDVGAFDTLEEGVSAVELDDGTLLRAPEEWTPEQVKVAVGGTLEANGLAVLPFDEAAR